MPGAVQIRKTTSELQEGLAALCDEGSHWRCSGEFMELCGLAVQDVESCIKKSWGNKELWLDIITTEIARGLGSKIGLEMLGTSWRSDVDAWVDGAFAKAVKGMSYAPPRPMASLQAAPFVKRIMGRLQGRSETPNVTAGRNETQNVIVRKVRQLSKCEQCGISFSARLGACPSCFPKAPPKDDVQKQSIKEAKQAEWRRMQPASLDDRVSWHEASEMMWCHGGSGGVFLLRFPAGKAICVKGGLCKSTLFAEHLAHSLEVRTARMRPVESNSAESVAIRQAVRGTPAVFDDCRHHVSSPMMVMEYIDGSAMIGMPAHEFLKDPQAASPWRNLGRLMGLDLLINNSDRFPLAWDNVGNLGNVMLGSCLGVVVGIDQSVQPITSKEGLEIYCARVRGVCSEAREGAAGGLKAVTKAIHLNTGIEVTMDQEMELREGLLELLHQVVQWSNSGEMERILEKISQDIEVCCKAPVLGEYSTSACCDLVRTMVNTITKDFELGSQ